MLNREINRNRSARFELFRDIDMVFKLNTISTFNPQVTAKCKDSITVLVVIPVQFGRYRNEPKIWVNMSGYLPILDIN